MPQVTVYIREEDLSAWKAIEKKSELLHDALKLHKELVVAQASLGNVGKIHSYNEGPTPCPSVEKKVPLCKIHGLKLDKRGRCLQKGCRYA